MEAIMQSQAVEHLSPDQFAEWIAVEIEGRRKGGPNLQGKYLKLVDQLPDEIQPEYRARTIEVWSKVESDLSKPKSKMINGRRFSVVEKPEASFFGPKPQPTEEPEPKDTPKEERVE